jgi:hypothetical protein
MATAFFKSLFSSFKNLLLFLGVSVLFRKFVRQRWEGERYENLRTHSVLIIWDG